MVRHRTEPESRLRSAQDAPSHPWVALRYCGPDSSCSSQGREPQSGSAAGLSGVRVPLAPLACPGLTERQCPVPSLQVYLGLYHAVRGQASTRTDKSNTKQVGPPALPCRASATLAGWPFPTQSWPLASLIAGSTDGHYEHWHRRHRLRTYQCPTGGFERAHVCVRHRELRRPGTESTRATLSLSTAAPHSTRLCTRGGQAMQARRSG